MIRAALFATGLAAVLALGAAAQEPHASTSTTPDTPVSVTENKNIQQGNGTATDMRDDRKNLHHEEKSAKARAKNDKEEAKSAKAQRKALKAQDKANREAMKSSK